MNWNSQNKNNKKAEREIKRYFLEVGFIMGNVFMKFFFWGLFLRIFFCSGSSLNGSSRGRRMRMIMKIVTIVTILAGLGFVFGVVWQCIPIQAVWKVDGERRIEGAKCLNRKVFLYSFGVFDVLMDLIVSWDFDHYPPFPLPIPVMTGIYFLLRADYRYSQIYVLPITLLNSLPITRTNRLGLISMFILGAFVISASITRMAYLKVSYTEERLLIWTSIESNFSMILCCLPALGNLSNQIWNRPTTLIRGRQRGEGAKTVEGAAARGSPSIHDWYDVSGQNFGKYPPSGMMGMMTNIHHSPNASPLGSEYDLRILPSLSLSKKDKQKWSGGGGGTTKREKWINKVQSVNPFVSSSSSAATPNNLEIGNLNHPQSATNITDLRYQNQENVPAREQTAWMKRNLEERSARALAVRDAAAAAANGRPKWTADTSHVGEFLRDGPQVPTAAAVKSGKGERERESCYVGKGKERAEGHGPL